MKRSQVNTLVREASEAFERCHWVLPANPRWDVTDFGLGDLSRFGLVLVNLAEEEEYCEKIMYARVGMTTPTHFHLKKVEDVICRAGSFEIKLSSSEKSSLQVKIDGVVREIQSDSVIRMVAGQRIKLPSGVAHSFWPVEPWTVIGEVSTRNDDVGDNIFLDGIVSRFGEIYEDESPIVRLISDVS